MSGEDEIGIEWNDVPADLFLSLWERLEARTKSRGALAGSARRGFRHVQLTGVPGAVVGPQRACRLRFWVRVYVHPG